nr:helix-turn-helix domain-containing protein [Lysinibacillus timonensis]
MVIYFPFQPELKRNTLHYTEIKPITTHQSNIALYYQFHTKNESTTNLSLIPDGCFDFLFCCHSSKMNIFLWTSPLTRKEHPELLNDCTYFGVRFYPEQTAIQLNYPLSELIGQLIILFEVLAIPYSILEEITACNSFQQRIRAFETFISTFQQKITIQNDMTKFIIQKIYASKGMISVKALSDDIGYTEQYIRRKFTEKLGFSPKQFSKIVQFQHVIDEFFLTPDLSTQDIVYENGFYDQAHFIKTFKQMTHFTPKQYQQYISNHVLLKTN